MNDFMETGLADAMHGVPTHDSGFVGTPNGASATSIYQTQL